MKKRRLNKILRNIKVKGQINTLTRSISNDPNSPLVKKRHKVKPKILAQIRMNIIRSKEKLDFYKIPINSNRAKLEFWQSEYEGNVQILGRLV